MTKLVILLYCRSLENSASSSLPTVTVQGVITVYTLRMRVSDLSDAIVGSGNW